MSTIWTVLRATAVVVGSSAALVVGGLVGTAHADPAQPLPAPNIVEQLANSAANAPQVLQSLATALGATPPVPAAPPPLAAAAIRVPQSLPAGVPGAASAFPATTPPGITAAIPGITSAVPGAPAAVPGITSLAPGLMPGVPAIGPGQLVPQARIALPTLPFLPVPLPQQLSVPGDLASLATGGIPIPRAGAQPSMVAASTPGAAPFASQNALLLPLAGLP